MKYELLHDSLAAAIDELVSDETKMVIRARDHILRRYELQQKGISGLLTREDLDYIEPYLPKIKLNRKQYQFVTLSQARVRRVRVLSITAVILIFGLISALAIKSWLVSRYYESQYLNARAQEILHEDPTAALQLTEQALALDDNEIIKKNLYQTFRQHAFYQTIHTFEGPLNSAVLDQNDQITSIVSTQKTAEAWSILGELKHKLEGHIHPIYDLAISSIGDLVSAGNDKTAILWDASGKQIQQFKPKDLSQAPDIRAIDISSDGQWILSGASNGEIKLWQRGLDTAYYSYQGDGEITDVSINADGQIFAAAVSDRNPITFAFEKGVCKVSPLSINSLNVSSMALSDNGTRLFTGNNQGEIQVWATEEGTFIAKEKYLAHRGPITVLEISEDQLWLLAGSSDSTASVRSFDNQYRFKLLGHNGAVTSVNMNRNHTLITTSVDSTMRIWSPPSTFIDETFTFHRRGVNCLAISPDQKFILSGGKDRRVVLTELNQKTGAQKLLEHREHGAPVIAVNLRDSLLQSIDEYSNYLAYDKDQQKIQQISDLQQREISAAVFTTDGKWVLTGGFDSLVQFWNLENEKILWEKKLESSIFSLAISPDQLNILIGCENGKAYLFDAAGKKFRTLEGHQAPVTALAFTPVSGKIITGSEDQNVIIWSKTGQILQKFREYPLPIQAVSANHDETLLVVAYNQKSVILIDLKGGYIIEDIMGHQNFVSTVFFSPTENFIVTGSDDKSVRIWQNIKQPLSDFLLQKKSDQMDEKMKSKFGIQ